MTIQLVQLPKNFKGMPSPCQKNETLHGLNILNEDLMLPAIALKEKALINNCQWMERFLKLSGVDFAPHGKTTMAPELFHMQMSHGAWGLSMANSFQVSIARESGIKRILMANQLVGRQNILYIINELKTDNDFEFYCLVDDASNIAELEKYAAEATLQNKINILIEVSPVGGRAGVRTIEEAIFLASELEQCPHLRLCGIECYEGVIHGDGAVQKVEEFLKEVNSIAEELQSLNKFDTEEVILTGGGTAFFDLVAKTFKQSKLPKYKIIIRPGCYLSHDTGIYDILHKEMCNRDEAAGSIEEGLQQSLEILAYVQSIPETNRAIITMGKRDVSFDAGLPTPTKIYRPKNKTIEDLKGCELTALNDQHAFMTKPTALDVNVGDIIIFTISHPCLTFDKWKYIPMVDENYKITNILKTYF